MQYSDYIFTIGKNSYIFDYVKIYKRSTNYLQ